MHNRLHGAVGHHPSGVGGPLPRHLKPLPPEIWEKLFKEIWTFLTHQSPKWPKRVFGIFEIKSLVK